MLRLTKKDLRISLQQGGREMPITYPICPRGCRLRLTEDATTANGKILPTGTELVRRSCTQNGRNDDYFCVLDPSNGHTHLISIITEFEVIENVTGESSPEHHHSGQLALILSTI